MSVTRVRAGANSATYLIQVDTVPRAITIEDWNQLPPGKLRDLLTSSFNGPLGDNQEFITAFAEAGGSVSAVDSGAMVGVSPGWAVDGASKTASLYIVNTQLADGNVYEMLGSNRVAVHVSVSYSASE